MSRDFAIAVSRFGIDFNSFLDLTPREFFLAIQDKEQYDVDLVEANYQMISESVRFIGWRLFNIQVPRKHQIRTPQKFMKFPWDEKYQKKAKKKNMSVDQMKAVVKSLVNYRKTHNKDGSKRRTS